MPALRVILLPAQLAMQVDSEHAEHLSLRTNATLVYGRSDLYVYRVDNTVFQLRALRVPRESPRALRRAAPAAAPSAMHYTALRVRA
eukprot:6186334-Pleurochrysis_carterae.AAC.3